MEILKATDNNIVLRIMSDDDGLCPSPREDDNLGTMVCWHRDYDLGDKHEFATPADFEEWLKDNPSVVLPLYLYDHGGLRIKVGSFQGLLPQGHAEFDTMQVGYIYCTHDRICEEHGIGEVSEEWAEKFRGYLEGEVKEYDQYLSGDVYGFSLDRVVKCESCGHESEEDIDSCWGFYGHDWKVNGMMEHVEEEYRHLFDKLEEV